LKWWRRFLVCVSWVAWPVFAFLVDLVWHLLTSTSRGCSIEGCDFTPALWELAIYCLPPLLVTAAWWRWRRRRSDASPSAASEV